MFWQNIKNQIVSFFRSRTWLSRIVVFNCLVWVALVLADYLTNYFTLKGRGLATLWAENWLCVSDCPAFVMRPWTIISYFFVHTRFLSLLLNMLILAIVGKVFYRYLGGRKFVVTYLACGVVGAFTALLISLLQSPDSKILSGSSAAVMGLFMALATYLPDQNVFFFRNQGKGLKLKYIAYIFVAIDLLSALSANSAIHAANLGGELCGFLMIFLPKKTGGLKLRFSQSNRARGKDPPHRRPMTDEEYNRRRAENERRIDEILDKISKSGYEKLTAEEKEFLFKSSNNGNQ